MHPRSHRTLLLIALTWLTLACQDPSDAYPRIQSTTFASNTLDTRGPYIINTVIAGDAPITDLRLHYTLDGDSWFNTAMRPVTPGPRGLYAGAISPTDAEGRTWPPGTAVFYYVELTDADHTERDPTSAPEAGLYTFRIGPLGADATLLELAPDRGPTEGGTEVFLYGNGFRPGARITFGPGEATVVERASGTLLRVITPPATRPGAVDVTLLNGDGVTATLPDAFTYTGPGCTRDADCPDGLICDADVCTRPDPCDGITCPGGQICDAGVCVDTHPCDGITCPGGQICDDGVCVDADRCATITCPDGQICDADRGACVPLCATTTCPDGQLCDPTNGACDPTPTCTSNAECDDGLACTGQELCLGGACDLDVPIDCGTDAPCVIGACIEPRGDCELLLVADGAPCPGGVCQAGACVTDACTSDADCDDGLICDGAERCQNGTCTPGTPLPCEPPAPCLSARCVEPSGACELTPEPDGTACGDGLVCVSGLCQATECQRDSDCTDGIRCNGVERCQSGACTPGVPVTCDTSSPCTPERCAEPSGACVATTAPNGTPCSSDDSLVCIGGACTDPDAPCTTSADCDDGIPCNGTETCASGQCIPGPAPDCDDLNPCTDDRCRPDTGACAHRDVADFTACGADRVCLQGSCTATRCRSDDDCTDGLTCNGLEACLSGACQPGADLDCSRTLGPCRAGQCDESQGGLCGYTALADGTPCASSGACQSGACAFPEGACDSDADCPADQRCNLFASACEAIAACTDATDCPTPGTTCVTDTCTDVTFCRADDDCPTGTICRNRICYLAPQCFSDLDCAAGERCDGTFCQPTTCASDADCAANWRCRADRCIPPVYCQQDSDCPLFGLQCINFTCQNPGGCDVDADCPTNQYCLFGACYFLPPEECSTDTDCAPPQLCNLGYCQDP